ncbi:MAG: type III pantothenate kinase [Ignavibacteria bacterium]
MFLACDIGNSRIKYALFDDDELIEFNSSKDEDSFLNSIKNKKFESAGISSVVPYKNPVLSQEIKKISGVQPYVIDKSSPFSIKLNYETLDTLGIDRICSGEGAYEILQTKFPKFINKKNNYVLIIDFGTATTINILKMPCEFIGGMILPGIEMMFSSLQKNTDQLPSASERDYKNFIGTSTNSSIASGIINSNAGLIDMLRNYLIKKKAEEIKIFATGGNSEKIIPYLDFDFDYEKALVLIGINAVCRKLKSL